MPSEFHSEIVRHLIVSQGRRAASGFGFGHNLLCDSACKLELSQCVTCQLCGSIIESLPGEIELPLLYGQLFFFLLQLKKKAGLLKFYLSLSFLCPFASAKDICPILTSNFIFEPKSR